MNRQASRSNLYDRLGVSPIQLVEFCQRWHVAELALFGSVLRDDFRPDSDIDMLVAYQPTSKRGLFEKMAMQEELQRLLQRNVDLVSKKAIEQSRNWIRRDNILNSAQVIYVVWSRGSGWHHRSDRPSATPTQQTQQVITGITDTSTETLIAPIEQQKLPTAFKDQLAAVRDLLRTQGGEWAIDQIAVQFKGASRQKTTILTCLESLEALGIVANHTEDGMTRWYLAELQKAG